MELAANEKKYGLRLSDLDIATRVACLLSKGESTDLTRKWVEEHNKLDALRKKQEELSRKVDAFEHELAKESKRLRRKHGLDD